MTAKGKAIRLSTYIDIPIEIGLPHFIQDDHMVDSGPLYGNFKLSLQSVVCHRGNSVDSGHYISLTRKTTVGAGASEDAHHWLRFDDLAYPRISVVDIVKALKEETPYLLFYQIVPVEGNPSHTMDGEQVPSYTVSESHDSWMAGFSTTSLSLSLHPSRESQPTSERPSVEIRVVDESRGRSPVLEARRPSLTISEPALGDGLKAEIFSWMTSSRTASPLRKKSRSLSRTSSRAGEGLAKAISRLAGMRSKEVSPTGPVRDPEVHVREVSNSTSSINDPRPSMTSGPPKHTQKPQKMEKSKNRSSRLGKVRDDKPDRECVVM
jgi:Ubiquitin carboxyl-terminal hydrolase